MSSTGDVWYHPDHGNFSVVSIERWVTGYGLNTKTMYRIRWHSSQLFEMVDAYFISFCKRLYSFGDDLKALLK